jgi:hypothetical protein
VIERSPATAPPRPDLSWLRHRSLRSLAAAGAPAAGPPPTSARSSLDLVEPAPAVSPPSGAGSLDLSAPAATNPPPAVQSAGSLDLSDPVSAAPSVAAPRRPIPPRVVPRARPGQRTILRPDDPTVVLNRIQSGVGGLTIEAVCGPAVGDVGLGAAFELTDGTSSIVQRTSGITAGPDGARAPILTAVREEYDEVRIDLRQSRRLVRVAAYLYSESGVPIDWAGTLVITLLGTARIEVPLEYGRHKGPVVALSLYNVDGEFVLRSERELVLGDVRDAVRSFGFDQITWIDGRTPVR